MTNLHKNIGVFALSLLAASSAVYLYSPVLGSHADSSSASPDVNISIGEVAALSLDTNDLRLSSTINSFVSGTINATVATNSQYGYTLTLEDTDNNTDMKHVDSNVSDVITSNFTNLRTSSEMDDNTWGFSLNSTGFYRIPVNGSPVALKRTSTPMTTASEVTPVDFGVKLGNIISGTYSDRVLFTLYVNGQDGTPRDGTSVSDLLPCSHNEYQDRYGYYGSSGKCRQVKVTYSRTLGNTAADTITSTVSIAKGDALGDTIPADPVWPGHTFLGWRNNKGELNVPTYYVTAATIPTRTETNGNVGWVTSGADYDQVTYFAIFSNDNCADGYALADGGCWNKALGTGSKGDGVTYYEAATLCQAHGYRNPTKAELDNLLTYYVRTEFLGWGNSINGVSTIGSSWKYNFGWGANGSLGDALGGQATYWTNIPSDYTHTLTLNSGETIEFYYANTFKVAYAGTPSGFDVGNIGQSSNPNGLDNLTRLPGSICIK